MNSLSKTARAGKAIHVLGAILGVLLFSLSLFSQVNTGTISGVVQDSSGAVIAGATVTIRNVDTGTARTVTSDEGGRYIVPVLLRSTRFAPVPSVLPPWMKPDISTLHKPDILTLLRQGYAPA